MTQCCNHFQTAMYLTPKDLLQISQLSKQFRSMFASRSAHFVWQTVFCNVNLKCFNDLNEIQFASLLYDKCCMVWLLSLLYHIDYTYDFFMFPSGMWTFHERMLRISHASSEIVSMLSNCKVKLFFYPLLWILLLWFYCSLITNANLFKQYPKAHHIINCLPASDLAGACYKPEAHLLIKKFLSLKKRK